MSGTVTVDAASADRPGAEPALLGASPSTDRVTAVGFFVAFGAFLLIVAAVPNYATSVWAPKAAVLMVLGAGGIPLLITRAIGRGWPVRSRSEMWAARMALIFLGLGLISVAGSPRPVLSLVGLYDQGTGWFFFAFVAGCWALGTALNQADRRLLQSLVIAGAVITAVVSMLQLVVGLNGYGILDYQGIPDGLQGNPIFSCAILAATLSLIQPRFRDESSRWGWIAVICGIGLGIGGERLPALASVLFYCWLIYARLAPAAHGPPEWCAPFWPHLFGYWRGLDPWRFAAGQGLERPGRGEPLGQLDQRAKPLDSESMPGRRAATPSPTTLSLAPDPDSSEQRRRRTSRWPVNAKTEALSLTTPTTSSSRSRL